jgi:acyl-CoA thioesterase FadM
MESESDTFLPVLEVQCRYRKALTYDMPFLILIRVKAFRSRALDFEYQIADPPLKTIYAEGITRHVFMSRKGHLKQLPRAYWKYFLGTT